VAAVVIALGAVMVLGAFHGGARWLALPALLIALPAGTVAAAGIEFDGPIGDTTHRPVAIAELPANGYHLSMGAMVVDLRELHWPSTQPVRLKVGVGVGHLVVYVPHSTCVRTEVRAGAGYVGVLGSTDAGIDVRSKIGAPVPAKNPGLILEGKIGMGAVEVRHSGSAFDDHRDRGRFDADGIGRGLAAAGCGGKPVKS
jgi:hypothetical protein